MKMWTALVLVALVLAIAFSDWLSKGGLEATQAPKAPVQECDPCVCQCGESPNTNKEP